MGDNFEQVRAMNELIEAMDENPEALKAELEGESSDESDVQQVNSSENLIDPEAEADLAGGLTEAIDVDEGEHYSVDDLLGLNKPEAAPEPEKEVPAGEDEPAAPAEEPAPNPVDERISELATANRELREQVDLLTKRALAQGVQPGDEKPTEGEEPPQLNDEAREYLSPYIEAATKPLLEKIASLEAAAAPMLEQSRDQQFGEELSKYVDGFSAANMPRLREELDSLSAEDKARYGNDFAGAVALASALVNKGAFSGSREKKPAPTASPLARRSHSEASGPPPASQNDMSEEAKLKALLNMDEDDFARADARIFGRE